MHGNTLVIAHHPASIVHERATKVGAAGSPARVATAAADIDARIGSAGPTGPENPTSRALLRCAAAAFLAVEPLVVSHDGCVAEDTAIGVPRTARLPADRSDRIVPRFAAGIAKRAALVVARRAQGGDDSHT